MLINKHALQNFRCRFVMTFERANLYFSVAKREGGMEQVNQRPHSAVV